ncbi:MAG: VWA domain-containing protein [Blastocatellia bacterium]|nr:VWA domain-containing protein [Blastocatellia bacterium]
MPEPITEAGLLTNTVLFCRMLRARGLAVTPSEAIDAVAALNLIDTGDRQETFLSLRSVLTSRVEDFPVFEEIFEYFWRQIAGSSQPRKLIEQETLTSAKVRLRTEPQKQKGLAFFLEHWGNDKSRAAEPVKLPGASDTPGAAEKDFSLFSGDELEEITRLSRRIARRLARNRSRRWKPVRRGPKVNLRRTLRESLGLGGELAELSFKRRKQKKTRLVVICDVSGSMDIYSRLLLQFVYGLQNSFARVETFVFSTSLERITPHLKNRTYDEALERLTANVRGWSGGTLIGRSLTAFNSGWSRFVDKRTIVIILSDGWDTGETEELAASLASIKRRAGKLIWLNPLLGGQDYQPLVRGMQAALPHIDVFAPLNNLASLRALEQHLKL